MFWATHTLPTHHSPSVPFPVIVPSPISLPISFERTDTHPKPIKHPQIEETKHVFELVRLVGVQLYHFQVRTPSFSRRFNDVRFGYYSCTRDFSRFRKFQACRELGEVPRRLGVVRLKVLDVGIVSFEVGRSWWCFPNEILWILALESGMNLFLSL